MPRKKKASFVPKKKQTLVPEPNWERLSKAKTQDAMYKAFIKVADFVHYEVPEREQIHWLKKWIREESGWDLHEETKILPDVHMMAFAKWGWIAIKLGFTPDKVVDSLTRNLKPVLESASEFWTMMLSCIRTKLKNGLVFGKHMSTKTGRMQIRMIGSCE
jgi:hypothetical protein